ncbi:MAG: 2-oxoacid:acceptor oxidoreductase family protein [Anaerolineales bacterium]|nr:2-oxoacid:acceptor oxidoreductase family protein [Anaerolineales bacterium]
MNDTENLGAENGRPPYPGTLTTTDGTGAVVWVETHISQGAGAYPITSSTTMGQGYQAAVARGDRNLWGDRLLFMEAESEHSSASFCEGFALAGGRATNFTSGQGLALMTEVLYTISGKRLPMVFHIGARALTSQSLNVHAGHDDVMGVSDTGWGILFAMNAQGAGDLALIARRAAENSSTPFLNAMDGFLTTHTLERVLLPEPELMYDFIGAPDEKLINLMDPYNPVMSGVVQNQDAYMKGRIAQRTYIEKVEPAVQEAMDEFHRLTGRRYDLIQQYRVEDAEYVLVGLGSLAETTMETVDWLRRASGVRVGALHVTCLRPFPGTKLVAALRHVSAVAVIERMDDPLAQDNPMAGEIKAAFFDALSGHPCYPKVTRLPVIYSCSAGLGSRDLHQGHLAAAVEHISEGREQRYFALGIEHELALQPHEEPDIRPERTFSMRAHSVVDGHVRPMSAFSMRGHSVGGFGSVTTNKVIADVVSDVFDFDVQAYPLYGSEKKGLPTRFFLTVAKEHVRSHSELHYVDFVSVNDVNAFYTGDPLAGLVENGTLYLQSPKETAEEVWESIPEQAKRTILKKKIHVFALDAAAISVSVASEVDLEVRMQGVVLLGIFLRVTPFAREKGMQSEQAVLAAVEKALRKYFGKRGEQVVQDNLNAVRRGYEEVFEIPEHVKAGKEALVPA